MIFYSFLIIYFLVVNSGGHTNVSKIHSFGLGVKFPINYADKKVLQSIYL